MVLGQARHFGPLVRKLLFQRYRRATFTVNFYECPFLGPPQSFLGQLRLGQLLVQHLVGDTAGRPPLLQSLELLMCRFKICLQLGSFVECPAALRFAFACSVCASTITARASFYALRAQPRPTCQVVDALRQFYGASQCDVLGAGDRKSCTIQTPKRTMGCPHASLDLVAPPGRSPTRCTLHPRRTATPLRLATCTSWMGNRCPRTSFSRTARSKRDNDTKGVVQLTIMEINS